MITSTTIFNNRAARGGGIDNVFGRVNVANTIVAGNTAGAGLGDDVRSAGPAGTSDFTSRGNNLIGDGDDAASFIWRIRQAIQGGTLKVAAPEPVLAVRHNVDAGNDLLDF
ncbi:MAG: hypothetical protein IH986_12600 [Planctomycetes bacterium]|nr:hypothetical protein [Planctomycetota bacterium]